MQTEVYEIKKDLINLDGFVNMRILTKEALLIQELTKRSRTQKEIKNLVNTLNNCEEEENKIINKTLMEDVLLPKTERTYAEFRKTGGDNEAKDILEKCYHNGIRFINNHIIEHRYENFNLRKCAKVARGELFLFTTNQNKDKYMVLEIQGADKEMNISVLNDQEFFARMHFDEDIDITKMPDILLQGKKILDQYLGDKRIRYVIASSRLFDDEFNDFWMKEREKEGKIEIPNRIKIREESLQYGGKLPPEIPALDDPIEENFIEGEENSMTRAIKKYITQGNILKEGGGYIDLEALEGRKSKQK